MLYLKYHVVQPILPSPPGPSPLLLQSILVSVHLSGLGQDIARTSDQNPAKILTFRIKVGHPTTLKSPDFKLQKSQVPIQIGIEIFKVKQGCGSRNAGNTARRFFRHPETPHLLGIKPEILDCLRDLVQM